VHAVDEQVQQVHRRQATAPPGLEVLVDPLRNAACGGRRNALVLEHLLERVADVAHAEAFDEQRRNHRVQRLAAAAIGVQDRRLKWFGPCPRLRHVQFDHPFARGHPAAFVAVAVDGLLLVAPLVAAAAHELLDLDLHRALQHGLRRQPAVAEKPRLAAPTASNSSLRYRSPGDTFRFMGDGSFLPAASRAKTNLREPSPYFVYSRFEAPPFALECRSGSLHELDLFQSAVLAVSLDRITMTTSASAEIGQQKFYGCSTHAEPLQPASPSGTGFGMKCSCLHRSGFGSPLRAISGSRSAAARLELARQIGEVL